MQIKTVADVWAEAWYTNIFRAYTFPKDQTTYCLAAQLCQMEYVIAEALKI